jgi:hypothetical protein
VHVYLLRWLTHCQTVDAVLLSSMSSSRLCDRYRSVAIKRGILPIAGETTMNRICTSAITTGVAFSAFTFATIAGSSAQAGPIVPPGRYCLTWDIGGSDCSFTSYAQCLATAAGLDAECYGKTLRDDEDSQYQDARGYDTRAQVPLTFGR